MFHVQLEYVNKGFQLDRVPHAKKDWYSTLTVRRIHVELVVQKTVNHLQWNTTFGGCTLSHDGMMQQCVLRSGIRVHFIQQVYQELGVNRVVDSSEKVPCHVVPFCLLFKLVKPLLILIWFLLNLFPV